MGIISRFGRWIDKKFPDQMTVEDVLLHFKAIEDKLESKILEQKVHIDGLQARIGDLQSDTKACKSGLTSLTNQRKAEAQIAIGPRPTEGWGR